MRKFYSTYPFFDTSFLAKVSQISTNFQTHFSPKQCFKVLNKGSVILSFRFIFACRIVLQHYDLNGESLVTWLKLFLLFSYIVNHDNSDKNFLKHVFLIIFSFFLFLIFHFHLFFITIIQMLLATEDCFYFKTSVSNVLSNHEWII